MKTTFIEVSKMFRQASNGGLSLHVVDISSDRSYLVIGNYDSENQFYTTVRRERQDELRKILERQNLRRIVK